MPVDAGSCYPNDKVWTPVTTGFSRGLVGYWGALVVAGLLLMQHEGVLLLRVASRTHADRSSQRRNRECWARRP